MVQIKRNHTDKNPLRSLRGGIFVGVLLVVGVLGLLWTLLPWLQNRGVIAAFNQHGYIHFLEYPKFLTSATTAKISTDVRGNLGPPEVMLTNGKDWIKDRWQAASDMHGTAIKGQHWVLLEFQEPVAIDFVVLDWEAAYSNNYILEGSMDQESWNRLYDTQDDNTNSLKLHEESFGQSPGVKTKTPLHVMHTIWKDTASIFAPEKLKFLRLTIRSSAMGWGVSLWQFRVYGYSWP